MAETVRVTRTIDVPVRYVRRALEHIVDSAPADAESMGHGRITSRLSKLGNQNAAIKIYTASWDVPGGTMTSTTRLMVRRSTQDCYMTFVQEGPGVSFRATQSAIGTGGKTALTFDAVLEGIQAADYRTFLDVMLDELELHARGLQEAERAAQTARTL